MKLLNTKEAAEYLGYTEQTLKSARSKGNLSGISPPKHIKLGKAVRYQKETLDKWVLDNNSGE